MSVPRVWVKAVSKDCQTLATAPIGPVPGVIKLLMAVATNDTVRVRTTLTSEAAAAKA
jgi:hypothetical protein